MRKLTSLLLLGSLLSGASAAPGAKPARPVPAEPAKPVAAKGAIHQFGARLHAQLGTQPGNLIYSPSSMAIALAMTREGALGKTAAEMDAVLGAQAGAEARALLKALASDGKQGGPTLAIANRLFGEQQLAFEKAFLDLTRDGYGAPLELVDFKKSHDAARQRINRWVETQTKDKIKDLLPSGSIDNLARLVLVNAIYLKAQWAQQFEKERTRAAASAVAGGASKQVPTMHGLVGGKLGSHGGARTLDLPYQAAPGGPQLSMLIVVPEGKTLAEVEARYARDGLAPFLAATTRATEVDVALPKFKIATGLELADTLKAMGMKRAFVEGEAEFGGMTKRERLFISKAIHKAFVEVDEKGTEAAAATAVVMTRETASIRPAAPVFKADRSFLFFIHDQHGSLLFGGRVLDPSAG